jgi:hypothetical protein
MEKWKITTDSARGAYMDEVQRKNSLLITNVADIRFPTRQLDKAEHSMTFIQSSVQRYCDEFETTKEDMYQVFWVDFTIPGYTMHRSLLGTFGLISTQLSTAPERSVAIIFAPNTGPFGDEYDDTGIMKMCAEVETHLKDPDWRMCYRTGTLAFDEDSMPGQSRRPGWHRIWICISDQKETDPATSKDRYKSHFAQSKLWLRSSITGIPVMPEKDMVNPLRRLNCVNFGRNMTKSSKRKQWLAGWRLCHAVQASLWKGLPVNSESHAAIIVLFGYDVSVHESVMRATSVTPFTGPREMVVTTVYADIDTEIEKPNFKIEKWIKSAVLRVLGELIGEKLFSVQGFVSDEFKDGGQRPTYTESDFKIVFPAANGGLPIRKEWIDLTKQKFKIAKYVEELGEMIKLHDVEFNPTGQPYDPTRGMARPPTAQAGRDDAVDLVSVPGSPETKEDLEKLVNIVASITHGGQIIHFTEVGGVWIWGEVDDVVSDLECIVQVFGEFVLDKAAEIVLSKVPLLVWKWAISTPEHKALYRSAPLGANVFPAVVKTLAEFLEFLEQNGKHNPQVDFHETTAKYERNDADEVAGRTWEIKSLAPCAFKALIIPKNTAALVENLGSIATTGGAAANWDWTTGLHNKGYLRIVDRMSFETHAQFTGIVPEKPGLFLAKSIRVVKGTLRQLA